MRELHAHGHVECRLGSNRMKNVEHWDFLADREGRWRWHFERDDLTRGESRETFQSRTDCIADAMRHGYLVGEPAANGDDSPTQL